MPLDDGRGALESVQYIRPGLVGARLVCLRLSLRQAGPRELLERLKRRAAGEAQSAMVLADCWTRDGCVGVPIADHGINLVQTLEEFRCMLLGYYPLKC